MPKPLLPLLAALLIGAVAPSTAAAAQPDRSDCRPVAVKTSHGKRYEAFCRLARVERGRVPCADSASGRVTHCRFRPASVRWIESRQGDVYALAGQSITRDGRAGGRFTIASQRDKDGRPPCAKPGRSVARAADAAGTPTGYELAIPCVVETLLSPHNASGQPLRNVTTREVCTSSFPHPDGAALVRRPSAGVFCYLGQGAGLNHPSGLEGTPYGVASPYTCHVVWSGGFEIYAAKRPSTRNWPSPGIVDTATPIVWRPYTSVAAAQFGPF
jgi:hypothetical protein